MIIILTGKSGNTAKVTTNYSEWSEGFGDWLAEKGPQRIHRRTLQKV
jgi:hypothetical protein